MILFDRERKKDMTASYSHWFSCPLVLTMVIISHFKKTLIDSGKDTDSRPVY